MNDLITLTHRIKDSYHKHIIESLSTLYRQIHHPLPFNAPPHYWRVPCPHWPRTACWRASVPMSSSQRAMLSALPRPDPEWNSSTRWTWVSLSTTCACSLSQQAFNGERVLQLGDAPYRRGVVDQNTLRLVAQQWSLRRRLNQDNIKCKTKYFKKQTLKHNLLQCFICILFIRLHQKQENKTMFCCLSSLFHFI